MRLQGFPGYAAARMQIPFTAYADDCTVTGEIALQSDRLSDFLASTAEFEVDAATFKALDDGHVVEAGSAAIFRDDLCFVVATGPRGRVERRLWTRQHPVRARIGPYVVRGYLHAPPTIDPLKNTDRRPILALTSSVVEYAQGGALMRDEAAAILLNSSRIDVLEAASEEDLGLSREVDFATEIDPRSKDLTGGQGTI
jgi:hypothetical protein